VELLRNLPFCGGGSSYLINEIRRVGDKKMKMKLMAEGHTESKRLQFTIDLSFLCNTIQKDTQPSQTCFEGYTFPVGICHRGVSLYLGSSNATRLEQ